MKYSSASSTSALVGKIPLAFSFVIFCSHPFCKEVIPVTRSKEFFSVSQKKFLSQVSYKQSDYLCKVVCVAHLGHAL